MNLLDTIADKLITDGVVGGASGWDVCKNYLPNTVDGLNDQVVAIYLNQGAEPHPQFVYPSISIHVRGKKFEYNVAHAKAEAVIVSLDDQTLTDVTYLFISTNIFNGGVDTNERPIAIINFNAMISR